MPDTPLPEETSPRLLLNTRMVAPGPRPSGELDHAVALVRDIGAPLAGARASSDGLVIDLDFDVTGPDPARRCDDVVAEVRQRTSMDAGFARWTLQVVRFTRALSRADLRDPG